MKHLARHVPLFALSMLLLVSVFAIPIPVKAQNYGGTFVFTKEYEPKQLCPNYLSLSPGALVDTVYERLVGQNYKLEIVPELAESWEVSADGLYYTFHLVQNATWHDGVKFTSADVKWSYESIIENNGYAVGKIQGIESIETPDDYTVVIKLKGINAGWLANLGYYSAGPVILPKHLWEGKDPYDNEYINNPVSTGPWIFKEWVHGSHITFEANENYWRGRPYLDKLIWKFIENFPSMLAALEKGEVHGGYSMPYHEMIRLDKAGIIKLMPWPAVSLFHVLFNLRRAPFNNTRVRFAIAHTIDFDDVVFRTWADLWTRLNLAYYEGHWATNPDAKMPEYDPEKAEQLLDEAGYPRGTDGVRFRCTLTVFTSDDVPIAGQIMKYYLHQVGIEVDVEAVIFAAWWEKIIKRHDFDFTIAGGAHGPDPNALTAHLSSTGFRNAGGWNNSRVDELLDLGRSTVDIEKRKEYYYELEDIMVTELPRINFGLYAWVLGYRSEYTGFWNDPEYAEKYKLKEWDFRKVHLVEAEEEEAPPLPIELIAGAAVVAIVIIAGAAFWLRRRSRPA